MRSWAGGQASFSLLPSFELESRTMDAVGKEGSASAQSAGNKDGYRQSLIKK